MVRECFLAYSTDCRRWMLTKGSAEGDAQMVGEMLCNALTIRLTLCFCIKDTQGTVFLIPLTTSQ